MIAGIIVPGRGYGPQAPLLDFADEALADRKAAVETIDWTVPDWLPHVAEATGKTVVTIEGGDHGLRPPGPLRAYAEALVTVGTAMEVFLSDIS